MHLPSIYVWANTRWLMLVGRHPAKAQRIRAYACLEDTGQSVGTAHAQIAMEAEDVARERQRAEEPDPLDDDICIILQSLSKQFQAEVRLQLSLSQMGMAACSNPDFVNLVRHTNRRCAGC